VRIHICLDDLWSTENEMSSKSKRYIPQTHLHGHSFIYVDKRYSNTTLLIEKKELGHGWQAQVYICQLQDAYGNYRYVQNP